MATHRQWQYLRPIEFAHSTLPAAAIFGESQASDPSIEIGSRDHSPASSHAIRWAQTKQE
jgi:hypothetical protein